MKDYKQTADSVLQRVHEYEQQNGSSHAKVRRIGKVSVIVLPVLIIAAVSVFALKAGFGSSDISKADDTSRSDTAAGGANDHTGNSSDPMVFAGDYWTADSNENDSSKAASSNSSSEAAQTTKAESSINPNERVGGQPMIAALPKNNRKQVIGEKITDEEARDYFNKNTASLQSSLTASGVELAEIYYEADYDGTQVICAKDSLLIRKGYCHVSYDGNTDESKPGLTVKQNFMDFHVYNADRLVAIVTLVKENGLITATPAFGAPWFDSFNNALNKYHGQKVLFLYAGAMAYAIAPDNTVIHPQGYESSVNDSGLKNVKDAYNWFYDERCVYTP